MILVTGATGAIGSLVVKQLSAQGVTVRALVRDMAKAEPLQGKGVQLAQGDFDQPESLARALDGVTSVFLLAPPHPDAAGMNERFLDVATKIPTAPRIVRLSAIKATPHAPTDTTRNHATADGALQDAGLPYVILRPNYFMQNILGSAASILTSGQMFQGMGDGRIGFIDVRDIADVATAVLLDHSWDYGIYDLTGPASVSFHDVAGELGAALGQAVQYVPVTPEAVRQSIVQMGWGEWAAEMMADYSAAYARGWGDFTTTFVQKIAGHESRSIGQFAREVFVPALRR